MGKVPCMSIMNMPPLPYLKRIPGLNCDLLKPAYTDPTVWDNFDPGLLTLCSPDPQAVRPPDEKVNVLQVTLPTNFKVAKFDNDLYTDIVRQLEREIDAIRFDVSEGNLELPVKLRVHDSIFVPLAKWAMLLAGNYRCITKDGMRTAQEAVYSNLDESRSVYNFVNELCVKLGANPNDLVPFEKYAAAAKGLSRPASAARALQNGMPNIERARMTARDSVSPPTSLTFQTCCASLTCRRFISSAIPMAAGSPRNSPASARTLCVH
jgi:hypothetical protein